MKTLFQVLGGLLCFTLSLWGEGSLREWTAASGEASFRGTYLEKKGEEVKIRREGDAQVFTISLDRLSRKDREWVENWESRILLQPPAELEWPRRIRVGSDYEIEVVEENRRENRFIYRSNHFEFVSDVALARGVVREFGHVFETTYLAVEAMPLRWNPQPPEGDHFRIRLFGERESYYAAGGIPNSGGAYFPQKREILVPLTSVGIRRRSSTYVLDSQARVDTLVHEVTHQVHHDWLSKLPIWLVEGLAVYMESIPFERNILRFDRQNLSEFFLRRTRNDQRFVPLETMFSLSSQEWLGHLGENDPRSRFNYSTSFLMAYFFFHLDDEGKGMYSYLRAIEQGEPETEARKHLLQGRDFATLTDDFKRALARQGLRLEVWQE